MCGSDTSRQVAPCACIQAMPCFQSLSISAGMPSMVYSLGIPTFRPLAPFPSAAAKSGTSTGAEVESLGSCPAMAASRMAVSSTERANGPAWSSDEANATMPQREQRP